MKKFLPILIVGILVFSGIGVTALQKESTDYEIKSVNFSNPILREINNFVEVDMPKTNSYLMFEGKPLLPSYKETFTYDVGTIIKSVTCKIDEIKTKSISKLIMPTPQAISANMKIKNTNALIDYGLEPFPNEWFTYNVGRGLSKDKPCIVLDIQVFPVSFESCCFSYFQCDPNE